MSTWDLPSSSPFRPWTDEESRALDEQTRRARGERIKSNGRPRPASRPRLTNGGRWHVKFQVNGQRFSRCFDTPEQAIAWRDRTMKENANG